MVGLIVQQFFLGFRFWKKVVRSDFFMEIDVVGDRGRLESLDSGFWGNCEFNCGAN
ncbi:hypothetical protein WH47_00297 [Habropoda laboriosa]|uniref:Uncharacterized protein n=1 Tax=Habropoda laboriosa TaxID=597456 RepID=A0A0L7R1S6_9HYME|nr:hypothetical protein WH47_00297 [Habropoda laboriosa]